ncbi:MAG: 3-hydroxybutyryl-CoA dehydrogenase [Bacteroidia bacterium]|nr:3-hydroxybutyryl-CoA dehydrogenase [Bacteroidia bacterium]
MIDKNSVIGIAGAGAMGSGIAQVAATAGHKVIILDTERTVLVASKSNLAKVMSRLVEKGKYSEEDSTEIQKRITYTLDLQYFENCNLIIEAIIENIEIKNKLFLEIEKVAPKDALITSNTSSLSIASIASVLKDKSRCFGIHFFNPAPLMPLVEIIPSFSSDITLVESAKDLISAWGKSTVLVKDTPGFIVNRLARPFYSEAIKMYEEGVANFATIDHAMREVGGFKMGPFELMDFIGNDVNYKVTASVFEQFFYDPRYKPSITQKRLFESGFFGRKSGRGYYDYSDKAVQEKVNDDENLMDYIFHRIHVMLINEAVDALFLKIASKEDLDTAMKKGVNYPKGLLEWADEIGLDIVLNSLTKLQDEFGEDRYRPSPLLKKMVKEEKTFFD